MEKKKMLDPHNVEFITEIRPAYQFPLIIAEIDGEYAELLLRISERAGIALVGKEEALTELLRAFVNERQELHAVRMVKRPPNRFPRIFLKNGGETEEYRLHLWVSQHTKLILGRGAGQATAEVIAAFIRQSCGIEFAYKHTHGADCWMRREEE